jgi:hypothetical protein
MRRRQVHLLCLIVAGFAGGVGVTASASVAQAQSPAAARAGIGEGASATGANQRTNANAERDRLRAELSRVQIEIDRLKTGERGLRTDYLLRARLADAEALARRLTELDAQLGPRGDGAARAPAALAQPARDEAVPSPTDGPAELEAKADILADQARRAQSQAVALQARIDQVRGRRELRRRAHQLENDPFAPLESSHRRLATGANLDSARASHDVPAPGPPPRTIATGGASVPPTAVATTPTASGVTATPGTTAPGTTGAGTPTTATAVQVRDVLDPSTPAQLRRADAALAPANDLESMERALAALNARAQHLDEQAKRLRAQARAR